MRTRSFAFVAVSTLAASCLLPHVGTNPALEESSASGSGGAGGNVSVGSAGRPDAAGDSGNEGGAADPGGTAGMPEAGKGGTAVAGAGAGGHGGGASGGTSGSASGGMSGGASGGTSGGASSGGSGGMPATDQLPWRALKVTAVAAQYLHTTADGSSAGLDTRVTPLAKLVVDLGLTAGGYQPFLGKRGFHVFGVSARYDCAAFTTTTPRDFEGDCRLNVLDGAVRGGQNNVAPVNSVVAKVTAGLAELHKSFPAEDWGYFLNQDATVRWSDVVLTGFSHGASDAVIYAHALRVSRVVAVSGVRDNLCGVGTSPYPDFTAGNPPYSVTCAPANISSWLDSPSQTPIDRYFGFAGKMDAQFGDILFAMDRLGFVGAPVNISTSTPPYNGSHRLYADVGHSALPTGYPTASIEVAFGVPTDHQNPQF